MNVLGLSPLVFYLECAMLLLTASASTTAYLLIRAARRTLADMSRHPMNVPSTPLTRSTKKRVRVPSLV